MSGILCVYSASGIPQDIRPYQLALRRLSHRGRDGEGYHLRNNLYLGVRRSDAGPGQPPAQPVVGPEGTIVLALDGQVHDREAFARRLRDKGHPVDPSSDGSVVLHAYMEFGEQCFEQLKGVWAVVLWDARAQRLVVSRDRLGVRPMYYYQDGDRWYFASEIKAILELVPGARAMDHARVRDFVRTGRIDDWTCTMFAGILPVPPGTVLSIQGVRVASTRYWSLRPTTNRSLTSAQVLDHLVEAVERHTPAGVPVGLALSGGVDSACLAGVLAQPSRRATRDLRAFSITPPHTEDESFLIDATTRHTGIPHTYVDVDGLDHLRLAEQVTDAQDEPVQYSGVLYQFVLRQRMAEAGCRTALVGYGADEIFAGYQYLAAPFVAALVANGRLAESVRWTLGAGAFPGVPLPRVWRGALRLLTAETRSTMLGPLKRALGPEAMRRWRARRARPELDLLIPRTDDRTPAENDPMAIPLDGTAQGLVFFRALLDCFRTLLPMLVRLEDRNATAHGLDLAAPFMDADLVETALAMPFHRFMAGGRNKTVLREAAGGLLAPEVRQYPRKLPTPGSDAHVCFDLLRPRFLEMLHSAAFQETGLWSPQCAAAYRADAASRARAGLWFRVYMVQTWYERVVAGAGR